jgi:hypothetical protein
VDKGPRASIPFPRPEKWVQDTWPAATGAFTSPDGKWTARIVDKNVRVRGKEGAESVLTTDGSSSAYYARLTWAADSSRIIAVKVRPGDRNKVFLIQNSPPTWGPAKLQERIYDRPGDRIDTFDISVIDPAKVAATTTVDSVEYGDLPSFRPTKDGAFTYEKMDRGYGLDAWVLEDRTHRQVGIAYPGEGHQTNGTDTVTA